MNKGELRQLVEDYAKRTDFSASTFDRWVEFTTVRIGRTLRGQDNITQLVATPVSSPYLMPLDFREMRSVEGTQGNATYRLRSVDSYANLVTVAGDGLPMVYRTQGFLVELRPFQAVPLTF